ncbi:glycoprotein 3-alpha-L-fucosyltransferase A-like isoform X2 [Ylistrum balloti]|uniref:glycoprotein 3-alpha-L-fucosyltransferase A-like isoform X2 n=1 Tax=Ylistrum balloti TaxID=509963 RepID=UPI002905858A|nr:glycoprotein 3-alpha-L-fucosyltransferase A-like isoform X2 [Ylistrum balloti]
MFRFRLGKLKYLTKVLAMCAVCLSMKLLHDTYQIINRDTSSPLPVENREFVDGTYSQWSILRRNKTKIDIYLEKLKHYVMSTALEENKHEIKKKIIKVHYFNKPDHVSPTSFDNCPDACTMTYGVNGNLSTSDAVMFQGPPLGITNPQPPTKIRGQIWVLHGSEAPVYWMGSLSPWRCLFNWTMSYRRDADIRHSYGDFRKRQSVLSKIPTALNIPTSFNPVGWFVSHCNTSSKRELYVEQLTKYVKTDIYGACGKLVCDFDKFKECLDRYKFYLSFENAICRDYITEKVFNIFQIASNTIPVVRGFKNQSWMFLPPGSYISTDEFSSPGKLGEYITKLPNNMTAFENYFTWKQFYESYSYEPNPFCILCRRLHRSESYRRLYDDIDAWLKGGNQEFCVGADDVE